MSKEDQRYHVVDFSSPNRKAENEWIFNELTAWELENGGNVNFIPADRFDEAICMYHVDVPTF